MSKVRSRLRFMACMVLVLLVSFGARVYGLGQRIPPGVHYDEAANVILANEIANGARPLFIKGYTGKEVLYFYLAAAIIKLIGHPLTATRLTSAFIGLLSVAVTARLGRELFAGRGNEGRAVAVVAAAIQGGNLWAINLSRVGFRASLQPLLQALTVLFILRGLRARAGWRSLVPWLVAGLCGGMAAYTYLAVRAFPFLLAPFLTFVVITSRHGRRMRLLQIGAFALAAAVVFAPLGLFYLDNPQFFLTRMQQVSVLSTAGDKWRRLWNAARISLAMFTVRGDMNWRFNVAGAPALWWPLRIFFYFGLAVGIWRLARSGDPDERAKYLLLLLWLPVMLLPAILGGKDVEISLSLRAVGVMPALFYWPALGMVVVGDVPGRRKWARYAMLVGIALLLLANALHSFYQCLYIWGPSVAGYYESSGYLVEAAEYLNSHLPADADVYVSVEHYRHPTFALLMHRYADVRWLVGANVLVLPVDNKRETWYVFTHEAMPEAEWLARYFYPSDGEVHRAPDGQVAFVVYRFAPRKVPIPRPGHKAAANLGNVLHLRGYDLEHIPVSGDKLDTTLYFEVSGTERDDWTFFAHLVDDAGFRWGGETFFYYPSAQWREGEVMVSRCTFPIWTGAPPDDYTLDVGAFSPSLDARLPLLDARGQMVGTVAHLGPIAVAAATTLPQELPPIQRRLDVQFPGGLTLLGRDRDRSELRPGETLALSLYWLATAPPKEELQVSLTLVQDGKRVSLWEGAPVRGRYPFPRWQTPTLVRDRYALRLPTDLTAGEWELRLSLLRLNRSRLQTEAGDEEVNLGTLKVQADERRWEVPPLTHEVGARLGGVVELVGYDLWPEQVSPGQTLHLRLVWRCLKEMGTGYTVFTHLLGKDGRVWGQQDNPPVGGRYPTTLWVTGEVVIDEYALEVKADALAGEYVLEVGMYDPADLRRLSAVGPDGRPDDRILLGHVQVVK